MIRTYTPLHCPESFNFLWVTDITSDIHLINGKFGYYRPHAASNRIFSTGTRLSNVTSLSLSMKKVNSCFSFPIYSFFFSNQHSPLSCFKSFDSLVTTQSRLKAIRRSHTDNPPRFIAPVWNLTGLTYRHATGQIVAGQISFVAAPTFSSTPT